MIAGSVNNRRDAMVSLTLAGPTGRTRSVTVAVDTGYNGSLTLPQLVIASLELAFEGGREVKLGDGTRRACAYYRGSIVWDGVTRPVAVLEVAGPPLLGTKLMDGHLLRIEYRSGGGVTIAPLPAPPGTPAPREGA